MTGDHVQHSIWQTALQMPPHGIHFGFFCIY